MQFSPIEAPALTKVFPIIIVPGPILLNFDIDDSLEISVGKLNPLFFNFLNIFSLKLILKIDPNDKHKFIFLNFF